MPDHVTQTGSDTAQVNQKITIALVLAIGAGLMFGSFGSWVVPVQTGLFVDDFNLSIPQSGLLGTVEIGGMSLAMLLAAPLTRRYSRARLAMVGAAIAALSQLLTILFIDYAPLVMIRLCTGLGCGLIYGAILAATASVQEPDRLMGLGQTLMNIAFAAIFFVAPRLIGAWGALGLFCFFAAMIFTTLPLYKALPGSGVSTSDTPQSLKVYARQPVVWGHFLGVILLNIGFGAAWGFAERSGSDMGITPATIGLLFSISTIAMIGGSIAAAWLSNRVGRAWPMLISAVLCGFSGPLLMNGGTLALFSAGLMLFVATNQFIAPYFMAGVSAQIDSSGALSSLTGGVTFLAYSLGVGIGGYMVSFAGYGANGLLILIVCVLSGLIFFQNGRKISSRAARVL